MKNIIKLKNYSKIKINKVIILIKKII